jgi:hypothetical protein
MAGRRKPWDQLSEGYRKRLAAHNITAQSHADPKTSLKAASGHGAHTPSEQRKRKTLRLETLPHLTERATTTGVGLTLEKLNELITDVGFTRARIYIDVKEARRDALIIDKTLKDAQLPSIESFVREVYGDDYYESYDWPDYDWMHYYHG